MTDRTIYDRFDRAFGKTDAAAILLDGKPVARVLLKYGAAVTAYVQVWGNDMQTGQAGGGGYDRAGAAVRSAAAKLRNDGSNRDEAAADVLVRFRDALSNGSDGQRWQRLLEDAGFVVATVTG